MPSLSRSTKHPIYCWLDNQSAGSPVPAHGDEEAGSTAKDLGTGRVSWPMMTFILLGDMFGLGTLTLPGDFARLGWVLAVAMMVLCLAGVLYSGRVFTLLAAQVRFPLAMECMKQ